MHAASVCVGVRIHLKRSTLHALCEQCEQVSLDPLQTGRSSTHIDARTSGATYNGVPRRTFDM